MISQEEIRQLAQLARLEVSEGEIERLQKDISDILAYVGQVQAASTEGELSPTPPLRNVMREDVLYGPETGLVNKEQELIRAFPEHEGEYAVVRKIIHKDE